MSAQLKTHLAVYGGGRLMVEESLIGKRMFNFQFTVMGESNLRRITLFLTFKLFKIFENFKTTFRCYFSNFLPPYFISGQYSPFIPEYYTRV